MSINTVVYFLYVSYRAFLRLLLGKKRRNKYLECVPFLSDLKMYFIYAMKKDFREDYNELYGCFNYYGKTVLDIGADYGSSSKFFLARGAKRVYAVERDLVLFKRLRENAKKDRRIRAFHINVSCPKDFTSLLRLRPDIVKVDCEGCEKHLLDIDNDVFSGINEYIIETHTKKLYNKFMNKFSKFDYVIQSRIFVSPQVTAFYATKNES